MKYLTAMEELSIYHCDKLDLMIIEEEKEEKIQPISLQIVTFPRLPATLALPKQLLQRSPVPIGHLSLNLRQGLKFFKVPMHSGNSLMLGQSPIINLCKEFVDP
jgi:hypothetical protein